MAEFPKFDEEFKQNVNEKFRNVKEKISDVLFTEEGKLDTEKISGAVSDTARKVEQGARDSYQKFSDEYVKDGSLDKEKLTETAKRTYRKAGRALATGVSKLADFLTEKFGTQGQNGEIVDSQLVTEEHFETEV
jgi:hypothetical protein